jgi:hypothetical protein
MTRLTLVAALVVIVTASLGAGCYRPDPADRAFKCDSANHDLCPQGLHCDVASGFCVHTPSIADMTYSVMNFNNDASVTSGVRTCGQRVAAGALSGLTNLGLVNGAGDESGLAVSNDGSRIYYLSGGALMTAALTNATTAAAPSAVTVSGVDTVLGLAFASDGSLFVSGVAAGVNQIFKMHLDSPTQATMMDVHLPVGQCGITDLAFIDGNVAKDLYVAYPLAGCADARGSYVAQGVLDKQLGTFVAALPTSGYRSPYVVTGGLTMLLATTGQSPRLSYAERPSTDSLWTGPIDLPLGAVGGAGKRDAQAVVSPDCKTLYLSSERSGGKGGLDLWAATIAPQ